MSEFRKHIIRSSATTDEIEQAEDYYKIESASRQLTELLHEYYGYGTSFLPYTHDIIETNDSITYRFNAEAAKLFIDELIYSIDEQYWRDYPLPDDFFDHFSEDTKEFYRSFLYLAIRIASIKMPGRVPEGHHHDVGSGTFSDLLTLTNVLVLPYSEAGFHRRFEIGIQDRELPQMFFDMQRICLAIGRENVFLHSSESEEEQANALKEDAENEIKQMHILASEKGMSYEQYKANNQYLRESNEYYIKQENEDLKKQLGDFEDRDTFVNSAITYRDLIFHYNNHDTERYIDTALKLFLVRNGHSVLSNKDNYLDAHAEIALAIDEIKDIEKRLEEGNRT